MSGTAADFDLVIEQGADFDRTVTWVNASGDEVDLTGYGATFQIFASRAVAGNGGAALFTLTNLDGITLGGTAGTVQVEMTAEQTQDLALLIGYYALKVISGASVTTRLLEGRAILSRGA